jgi:hypothetical protein
VPQSRGIVAVAVLSFMLSVVPVASAQVFRNEASHLAFKAGLSGTAYAGGRALGLKSPVAAVVATAAPTVIGKLMYAPKGLAGNQRERWPSVGFVVKDMAAELAVQSGPILIEWARRDKSGARWPLVAIVYVGLVRYVSIPLEIR